MEEDIDPERFDLIVVGTGLPESILAAAAASSGRKVLHLDSQDYYGSEWASMPFERLSSFVKSLGRDAAAEDDAAATGADAEKLGMEEIQVRRDETFLYSSGEVHEFSGDCQQLGPSHGYSIDTAGPKLILCAGALVDLLIKCGASNYVELREIEGTYMWTGSCFNLAPTSREELFRDRSMAPSDKRRLMSFVQQVQKDHGEVGGSFVEFLQRLPPSIQSIVLYAVALLDEEQKLSSSPVSAEEGLQLSKLYLSSIGRFQNNGALLYTAYGQAEIPQAFCRVAAVNGALYVLRRPIVSVLLDKETRQYKGVRTKSGQLLYSEKIVLGALWSKQMVERNREEDFTERSGSVAGRCICITDASLLLSKNNIVVIFPPRTLSENNSNVVRVLQQGRAASVSPDGKYVVQISTIAKSASVAKSIIQSAMRILFFQRGDQDVTNLLDPDGCKPQLLWSGFYAEKLHVANAQVIDNRIGVCSQPGSVFNYEPVIASTEKMFHQLFGSDEWFPAKQESKALDVEVETSVELKGTESVSLEQEPRL